MLLGTCHLPQLRRSERYDVRHFRHRYCAVARCRASSAPEAVLLSWQVSGSGHRADLPGGTEIDTTLLEATYFFRPVDDAVGPYATTPSLSRSSHVTATVQRIKSKQVISYVYPLSGLRVSSESSDKTSSSEIDADKDGYALFGGKYLGPSTALELMANSTRQTTNLVPVFGCVNLLCTPTVPSSSDRARQSAGCRRQRLSRVLP